jgi:hypothetical protein
MNIFKSHLISMVIYSLIVSVTIALIRYDNLQEIKKYALKIFLYMTCGVIIFSWVMYFF